MIDVGALRALRSVAALGTLARAADELGFTASAVSQQIKRLERQVGVPVLAPAGRGVVLTPAGQAIVDSAPEVFQALERCAEAAQSVSEGAPRGMLRVVAFSTAIRGLLAPAIPRLSARCPDLRVRIAEQDPDQALPQRRCRHSRPCPRPRRGRAANPAAVVPDPAPCAHRRRRRRHEPDASARAARPATRRRRPRRPRVGDQPAWHGVPPVVPTTVRRRARGPDVRHLVDDFATQLSLVASGDVIALIPRLAPRPWRRARLPAAAAATQAQGARGAGGAAPMRVRRSKRC